MTAIDMSLQEPSEIRAGCILSAAYARRRQCGSTLVERALIRFARREIDELVAEAVLEAARRAERGDA